MGSKTAYHCVADYEEAAKKIMPKVLEDYVKGAANDGITYRENELAYKRYRFRQQLMKGITNVNLTTTLLGCDVNIPIGVSPFACVESCHPDGEIGVASVCRETNTCYIKSDNTFQSLEELVDAVPSGLKWMQFYLLKERKITVDLLKRAEQSGYKAVVFTIDGPVSGRRIACMRNDVIKLFKRVGNYDNQLVYDTMFQKCKSTDTLTFISEQSEDNLTWDDLSWVKRQTKLPVVVKGIMTDVDAEKALLHGADAILVSNHGGRQLDGVPATIDVLEEVVKAVAGRCEVYIDGGIRSGTDVLKALALGAKAVFIARPVAWALATEGKCGVENVLQILKEELEIAMKLCGVSSVTLVDRDIVRTGGTISNL